MYFNAETQGRILRRFHFALHDGGVLLLGKSEMMLSHRDLFAPVDLKQRIFVKQPRATLASRVGRVAARRDAAAGDERPREPRRRARARAARAPDRLAHRPADVRQPARPRAVLGSRATTSPEPFADLELAYAAARARSRPVEQALRDAAA